MLSQKSYDGSPTVYLIPTPIGNYNPDWAILLEVDGQDKLYFVIETKSGKNSQLFDEPLRASEKINIECGKKHFEALNTNAEFKTANETMKLLTGDNNINYIMTSSKISLRFSSFEDVKAISLAFLAFASSLFDKILS